MATTVSMTFNLDAVLRQMNVTLTRGINAAAARAINRTLTSERAAIGSDIAKNMGIRVGTVKDAMTIEKATTSAPVGRLLAKGKRIPRIEFNARGPEPSRGRGRGVSYRGEAGRIRVENAFIATMRTGHRGVFVRRTTKRLPIRELFGPSIAHVFEKLVPNGEARRNEVLVKNLQHEIEFALSRAA